MHNYTLHPSEADRRDKLLATREVWHLKSSKPQAPNSKVKKTIKNMEMNHRS